MEISFTFMLFIGCNSLSLKLIRFFNLKDPFHKIKKLGAIATNRNNGIKCIGLQTELG